MKPFELYYDPLDMTTCAKASTTVGELNRQAKADRLYFPLYLTEEMPLGELVLGYRFTSRSFRFGPLCDNVLGFNFVLPTGKTVKVGAQVVKNVTGFDFARFLTNSGYRFGSVERVILRLRSLADTVNTRLVTGSLESLNAFRKLFLASPKPNPISVGAHGEGPIRHTRVSHHSTWSQLLDAFDFVTEGKDTRFYLTFSCEEAHVKLFDIGFNAIAKEAGCKVETAAEPPTPPVHPHSRVKTVISKTLQQADGLVRRFGGTAHGFLGNAFFHYDPPTDRADNPELIQALQALHEEVGALGGHVRSDKLKYPEDGIELKWEQALREKWEAMA